MPLLGFALFMLFAMTHIMLGDEAGKQIFIGLGVALPVTLVLGLVLLVWTLRSGTAGANRYDVAPQLEPKGDNISEP
jgi:uncharacterized membrane protein YhaH (DUF805 family)